MRCTCDARDVEVWSASVVYRMTARGRSMDMWSLVPRGSCGVSAGWRVRGGESVGMRGLCSCARTRVPRGECKVGPCISGQLELRRYAGGTLRGWNVEVDYSRVCKM